MVGFQTHRLFRLFLGVFRSFLSSSALLFFYLFFSLFFCLITQGHVWSAAGNPLTLHFFLSFSFSVGPQFSSSPFISAIVEGKLHSRTRTYLSYKSHAQGKGPALL
jgi:hypothetical protein